MLKLLKMLAFSIGSLNDGWFGFSFWPVTSFSMSVKLGKHRFCIGGWQTDGSDPIKHPMVNRVGWEYHRYYPVLQTRRTFGPAWVWKPCMSSYYGYLFGRPFYFSHTVFPCPPNSRLTPEKEEEHRELERQYADYSEEDDDFGEYANYNNKQYERIV